jgi:hypothetical protein
VALRPMARDQFAAGFAKPYRTAAVGALAHDMCGYAYLYS